MPLQNYGDNPLVSFYVNEATFFDGLGARYPSLVGDYEWFLFTDTTVLTVDTVQSTRDALTGLETDVNKGYPRSTVLTLLENSRGTGLLTTYQRDLTLARVPVFLFLSLVVMVVLYFLTVVVGLLAPDQERRSPVCCGAGGLTCCRWADCWYWPRA